MTQDRQHNSPSYNYRIVEIAFGDVDAILDFSELHDYKHRFIEDAFEDVDAVLDFSEFYDYKLGGYAMDYIIYVAPVVISGKVLTTDDDYPIITNDNYLIEYV
jgi:hypothetical protein